MAPVLLLVMGIACTGPDLVSDDDARGGLVSAASKTLELDGYHVETRVEADGVVTSVSTDYAAPDRLRSVAVSGDMRSIQVVLGTRAYLSPTGDPADFQVATIETGEGLEGAKMALEILESADSVSRDGSRPSSSRPTSTGRPRRAQRSRARPPCPTAS
jgi:hypothetical protein